MSQEDEFMEQLANVRQTTRNLIESVLMDTWPRNAAVIDFGLDSQEHYEALYYPIREGEIMPQALDDALGHGERLTALVAGSPSNPHKDVLFSTSWDGIFGRETPTNALSEEAKLSRTLDRLLDDDPRLSSIEQRELAAEIRQDEQAARVRDFGAEDAATYDDRMAEASRLRGLESGPEPAGPAELEKLVVEAEQSWLPMPDPANIAAEPSGQPEAPRGWQVAETSTPDLTDYDRLLDQAVSRAANDNTKERGPER